MLRVLHTSDWHLGQTLRDRDRADEHAAFLRWLVDTVVARAVDVVLVAGDVFDVTNPPAAAQRALYGVLAELRRQRPSVQVVLVAGNHDSPARLDAPSALAAELGVRIIGRADARVLTPEALDALVLPLRDDAGAVRAWCLAVPFLRAADVPAPDDSPKGYLAGVEALYTALVAHADTRRAPEQALVAMGHATVADSRADHRPEASADASDEGDEEDENEAVQRILLGGTDRLPARTFDPRLAYVALGHLHRAGRVGGRDHVRYAGSPIPLSFAERTYRHGVVLVELDGPRAARIERLEVPRVVPMVRVPAARAPWTDALAALEAHDFGATPAWLEIPIAAEPRPPVDLSSRLQALLADKPVRAFRVDVELGHVTRRAPSAAGSLDDLSRLDAQALLAEAWRLDGRAPPVEPALAALLAELEAER
jgi:exonuclease SbcD